MKVHLAGVMPWRSEGIYDPIIAEHKPYILESFYYVNEITTRQIPNFGSFMLDSGAFTFLQNRQSGNILWEDYVERYAHYINENKVKLYFELDIDGVVGYPAVLDLRKRLEGLTGTQSIPVWHKSRGIQEFKKMCHEYPYVAIGGYVIKELSQSDLDYFPIMIDYAHKCGAKIHCLGYTKLKNLRNHHFDSVDSTTWTSGNRFGYYYKFDGKTIVRFDKPEGYRIADAKHCAVHNFIEWLKFQKWADTHL